MWSQIKSEADFNDFLAAKISRELADKIASKMTDAAFPVRVVAKTGKYVTINRGEGAGVSVGDEYTVFAAGRKMKDPDTGEFLGTEEIPIGKIRIEAVSAKKPPFLLALAPPSLLKNFLNIYKFADEEG